jgi:hypothetical protein
MAKITGRIEVFVNGISLLNKAGAVASGIGESGKPPIKREPIIGDTGYHGDKETIVPAKCEVTVTDRDDISLSNFAKIQGNGTIIFRAARGGKIYTMHNATCAGDISVTGGEGETKLEFYGHFWTETTSAAF